MKTLSALLIIMLPLGLQAETVYLTGDSVTDSIGAMDANIMADDVHIAHSAIITNITMLMAIASGQNCGLWIFDSLNSPALYFWPFTNTSSASSGDMKVYSFRVNATVPKDFYVGFSAEGDGWGTYSSDYVRCGYNVITGVASNSGKYYYGPVSGGQLVSEYTPGYSTFFTIQIKEAPLRISALQAIDGGIRISVTNFLPTTTNHLELNDGAAWVPVTRFIAGASGTNWTGAATNRHALYRLRRE